MNELRNRITEMRTMRASGLQDNQGNMGLEPGRVE